MHNHKTNGLNIHVMQQTHLLALVWVSNQSLLKIPTTHNLWTTGELEEKEEDEEDDLLMKEAKMVVLMMEKTRKAERRSQGEGS